MRRLVQHALVGVGFVAVVTSTAVAGLGSPPVETTAAAAPVAAVSAPVSTPSVEVEDDAARAAREAEESRSATRAQLVAASTQAGQRAAALEQQSRAITAQRAKIKANQKAKLAAAKKREAEARAAAVKAKAAAVKAAARAAAAKKAMNEQGYKPGTADPREIARQILKNKFDYGDDQYSCFNNIIIRESNWDVNATNASSGAYGIPQALPGTKMASVADDWRTNPATQIIWGVQYMKTRYGSPCAAWGFKSSHGWY